MLVALDCMVSESRARAVLGTIVEDEEGKTGDGIYRLAEVQMHSLLHGEGMIILGLIVPFGDACSHGTTPIITIGASRQSSHGNGLCLQLFTALLVILNGAWAPKLMA